MNKQLQKLMLCALAAFALLLSTPPADALAAEIVKVDRVSGTVKVRQSGDKAAKWEEVEAGHELEPGWELKTEKQSKALLVFPKDNTVVLKELSFVRILELDSDGAALIESDQPGGLLVTVKNRLGGGKEFRLQTPSAHAIVRGTEYGAQITRDGLDDEGKPKFATEFYGYEGEVEIDNEFGTQLLKADQTIRAVFGAIPGMPVDGLPSEAYEFLEVLEDPEQWAENKVRDEIADKADEILDDVGGGGFGGIKGLFR